MRRGLLSQRRVSSKKTQDGNLTYLTQIKQQRQLAIEKNLTAQNTDAIELLDVEKLNQLPPPPYSWRHYSGK